VRLFIVEPNPKKKTYIVNDMLKNRILNAFKFLKFFSEKSEIIYEIQWY